MVREYYSIPEAAAKLGISRIAVFKRVKKGKLEALRIGRNWAVPAAALEEAAVRRVEPVKPVRPVPPPPKPVLVKKEKPPSPDLEMDSMGWD